MDDLVKRLRAGTGGGKPWMDLHEEAADRIEALERQVKAADALAGAAGDLSLSKYGLKAARVRTALAAYEATKEGGA